MGWQPSPRRSPIGIDANGRYIHAVQLGRGAGGWRVEAAASIPRPVAAEPMGRDDAVRLAGVLGRQGFQGGDVVLAVPSQQLLYSHLNVPAAASAAAMTQIARAQLAAARKCDPHALEVACWQVPAPARAKEGKWAQVVGCETQEVNALIDGFEEAGLTVRTLDIESWAATRACRGRLPEASRLSALLNLGWSAAHLVVLHRGSVIHERFLPDHGLRNLHAPFAEVFDLDPEVTEYIIGEIGFDPSPPKEIAASEVLDAARQQIAGYIDGLASEVRRSLSYSAQEHGESVSEPVLLHGEGASIPGVAERLSSALGESAEPVAPAMLASCRSTRALSGSPALMTAFGLALHAWAGPNRGVNLVPDDRREARRRRRRAKVWAGACTLYAFAWLALYLVLQATMASDDRVLREGVAQMRAAVQEKDAAVAALRLDLQQAVSQLQANLAVGKQPDWSILLALLSSTLEEEVVLRNVRLISSVPEQPGGSSTIALGFGGLGLSQGAVSRLVLRLEEIPLFRSVKLMDTRRESFMSGHAIAFQVECVLDDGEGQAP